MNIKYKIYALLVGISLFAIIPIICYFFSHIFYFFQDIGIHYLNFLSIYFDPISCWFIAIITSVIFASILCTVLFGDIE